MDMKDIVLLGIAAAAAMVLYLRRIGGRYGKIRPSSDVTDAYERFQADPNRNYYISGSDACPSAIIGIDKAWTLESDLWKARDLDAQDLKELVQSMQSRAMELNTTLHGFDIYDHRGRKIGDWFSILGFHVTVKMAGEGRVIISTPPADAYR